VNDLCTEVAILRRCGANLRHCWVLPLERAQDIDFGDLAHTHAFIHHLLLQQPLVAVAQSRQRRARADLRAARPGLRASLYAKGPDLGSAVCRSAPVGGCGFGFVTYRRTNGTIEYSPRLNPDFVAEVRNLAQPGDTLLITCRSGDRSARAVDLLAAAGFKKAYTVVDGVEGDKVTDPDSVFYGKRMKNGWKNSAPWVYDLDPEKFILEEATTKAPGRER